MKKILSWMLTLALCLSLLPTMAMATDEGVYTNDAVVAMIGASEYSTLQSAVDAAAVATTEGGQSVLLVADVKEDIVVSTGAITLDLNGHVITGTGESSVVAVEDAAFTLEDSKPNAPHDPAVTYIDPITNETVIVTGGIITGGVGMSVTTEASDGGGVFVRDGSFVMNGGTICGNLAKGAACSGGGVCVFGYGAFTLNGGAICGNVSENGSGGVNISSSGAFSMTGGSIRGNMAERGGGLGLSNAGRISGGTISGNLAYDAGGGISYGGASEMATINDALVISGGEISGNKAEGWGGGGIFAPHGVVMLSNGLICNNIVDGHDVTPMGGGVLVVGSFDGNVFNMTGGEIRDNAVIMNGDSHIFSGFGGGVCIYDNVSFSMSGGIISGNMSALGGGIYASVIQPNEDGGILTISGGEITKNAATSDGGGVFVENKSRLNIFNKPLINENVVGGINTNGVLSGGTRNNLYLSGGSIAALTSTLLDGARLGITTQINPVKDAPVTITSDYKTNVGGVSPTTYFFADDERYHVDLNDEGTESVLALIPPPTYTATFIADGETVTTITFTEGDESLDEPVVPTKNGFVGRWSDYDLKNATDDITITAIYTALPTHTAIFKIGDTVIATVPFTEGDAALDEPRIPDKPNYVGAWDAYDLANAKSDITVEGRYTPVDPDAVSDLGGDAEASYNNGVVTITLHASAPSQTIKVTSEKARPVDVVLVLDQSGSMKDTLGGRQSKRDALVDCANSFVQQLYQNAVATGANHRVALVGFACSDYNSTQAENRGGYVNTGLLATPSGAGKGFNSLTNADYAAALLPIKSGGSINANVITGINSIAAGGATAADVGLKMAKNIFSENPVGSERERIVIFITDGTPTRWTETKANIEQTAQNAIYIASTIKNAQGAKIYSVGVEATANPSTAFSSAASGVTTDWRGNFVSYDFNRFLHAVSSNYPAAASMSNLKDGDKGAGYYMAVNNTASLTKIFDNILYNTVYELKTFDKATLSYTLTNDFILTMEQELAMRAALTANGLTDADILVTRNNDGTTELTFRNVPVTQGVVNGTSGYHATVSFDVSAAKDTSGSVATGSASGVSYGDGDTQTSAGIANVTIPADRSVVVFKLNGKVYRMVDAAQGETITVPESELATWTIPDGATVNSAYVEFEATVSDTYNVHWMIDGADTVQSYHVGDTITPPSAEKAGHLFTGWMPVAPAVMPAHDVTCTATFTEHTHQWAETYKTGTCDTGITTHYVCGVCGEVKSEFTAIHDHNYTAVLSDNGSAGTTVEKLVCTDCGYSKNQEVRFKITYTESYKTKVLDLNLYENEVSKSGATNEELEMRFFIGDDGGKTYRVTRIDADDSRTYYNVDSVDGYLVFKLDHFSIYVISEVDEATNEPTETVSYSESVQLIETAQPVVDDTPLADQTNNPSNPSTPSNPSNPSNPSKPRNTTPYYPWYQPASPSNTPSQSDNGKQQDTDEKQPETPWQNPYADVSENTYYFKAVAWASKLGVTLGTSETTFSPNKVCSRAEIVTFLWRAKGCPEPTLTTSPFDDLDESAYYYKAALWAYENGITNGASDTSFAPGADCTRAQVVTFLWRAEGKPTTSSALAFVDVNDSEYYAEAVAWASEQEITNGTGDGNFSPAMVCTRAQIVTFLYRDMAEEAVA